MKRIKTPNKIYEVNICKHCKQDGIGYNPKDEPWHDEQWECKYCDSTYVIFNTDIATDITEQIKRDNKLNELGIND